VSIPAPRGILLSGWRLIAHSYSVIVRAQCLEILRRGADYRLWFEDFPYYIPDWRPGSGLCAPEEEAMLRAIPAPSADLRVDAELRFGYPYDFLRAPRARRTLIFGTAELLCVPPGNIAEGLGVAEAQRRHSFGILTCSNWSKEGFVRSGVAPEAVVVLPLGFDPRVFAPVSEEARARIRAEMNIAPDEFVFYHASAMTPNKGLSVLLPAFARLAEQRPQARLLLKGADALYASRQFADRSLQALDAASAERVLARLHYVDRELTGAEMARLYHAADCYVSSYLAEGFNLPVLEAAACGLPVVCTAGGATDDFVTDDFALRIESTIAPLRVNGVPEAHGLVPDPDHLVHLMLCAMDDSEFRAAARLAGPAHVRERFTWQRHVDRLLPVLFADAAGRAAP
jgi:glycosyltransferase involved in cell wall biosynthesis